MSHWSANDSDGMTPFTEAMCLRAVESLATTEGIVAGVPFAVTSDPDGNTIPDGCYYYPTGSSSPTNAGKAFWNSNTDFATAASPSAALAGD